MDHLTKDFVDEKFEQIENFERTIPGIRYGEDYPEFALAVVGSEAFKTMVQSSTMIGMLSVMIMKPPKEFATEEEKKAEIDSMFSTSPLREVLLRAIYLGYKLGKISS